MQPDLMHICEHIIRVLQHQKDVNQKQHICVKHDFVIVRVQYFVRGGSVGHRSRASSKHLSPHLPVDELDSSGGQTGVALHLQMHVWVSGPQRKPTRC
ncbi:hypothetical protein TNCV_3707141 [Trichonephila clavipes]|nr:hypothetical protein TNCV_3707141 [Trichonephila clavipes]